MENLVSTVVDEPMDFTVIAQNPQEMQAAQKSMILWAARKIQAVKIESSEAKHQYDECVSRKWSTSAWRAQIIKHEKRAEFYRKIKAALEAGYYIVPPFPIDIFAIRTDRAKPKPMESTHPNNHDQAARVLPSGVGRYVDPKPMIFSRSQKQLLADGTKQDKIIHYADRFMNVDFPFKLAKAEIRSATEAAMKLGIFDELGALPRFRAPDPIICGRILDPSSPAWHSTRKGVTFFVVWWLDTKTI